MFQSFQIQCTGDCRIGYACRGSRLQLMDVLDGGGYHEDRVSVPVYHRLDVLHELQAVLSVLIASADEGKQIVGAGADGGSRLSNGENKSQCCTDAPFPEPSAHFQRITGKIQFDDDIRIDVMRASGNGGQCVNTTDSAVRLTHYPTGIVIYSQTEKSQLQNKDKAFALLRAKLYDLECQKRHDAESEARKSQIGTGDRSEKIRTYNFPQGRVTDHRIGLTLYKLDKIMNGDIQEIIDACIAADQAAKLANMNE